ncbi:putative protein RICE SALT SENSITIVE 3 [Helianthus annuus]|nr:putative protein RICE SALT SENSITIVE 3 [Helianthus annuus]
MGRMLMWEDGFCRGRMADSLEEMDAAGEDPVRKAFSKILMGKIASDKCHKWVFKEPSECDQSISNYWQSSFDASPVEVRRIFTMGLPSHHAGQILFGPNYVYLYFMMGMVVEVICTILHRTSLCLPRL